VLGLGVLPTAARAADNNDTTVTSGPAASGGGDQVEEVVVSARKRKEKLQDVPVAETSLGARALERDNLTALSNLQYKLPAFSFNSSNPKQTQVGIRGIGNNGSNADGIDPSVGVFVDGVYAGRLGTVSNEFNDLASVEYLRGPQGTLFGKNTTAGVIQFNSQKPSFTPEADFISSFGNYNLREFKANVSGPVVADKLAVRAAAYSKSRDGTVDNLVDGRSFIGQGASGIRVQAQGVPSDDLSVRLIASRDVQHYQTGGTIAVGVVPGAKSNLQSRMAKYGYTLQTNPFDRVTNYDQNPHSNTETLTATALVDWDTEYGTFSSVTGVRHWYFMPYNDNDNTQLNGIADFGSDNDVTNLSQELRWASPKGSTWETVGGLYLASQELKSTQRYLLGNQYWLYANKFLDAASTKADHTYDGLNLGSHYELKSETAGVFGHTTYHVTDDLAFNAGVRQTWEHKTLNYVGYVSANPNGASADKIAGVGVGQGSVADQVRDSSLGGQFGISYKLTPDVLSYAQVTRGHKAKGLNPTTLNATQISYGASQRIKGERADSLELGTKSEWFNKRLLLNLAGYATIVKDYQSTASFYRSDLSASPSSFLTNVGWVRSKGLELEATALPLTGLKLNGFVSANLATYASYHDAPCPQSVLNKTPTAVCDITGDQVAWTPKWTAEVNAEYARELRDGVVGYVVADYNWRSSQNLSTTLDALTRQGAYGLVNLRVGVRLFDDALDVSFFVKNLFNRDYYVALSGGTSGQEIVTGIPGDPLTLGGTLHVRF